MKNNKDICYMILSHERYLNQITLNTLKRNGINRNVYIVIDNEDEQGEDYKRKYKEKVIVFDKSEEEKITDTFDNDGNNSVVLFARNFAKRYALKMGYKYVVLIDDDIKDFMYRYIENNKFKSKKISKMSEIFQLCAEYMERAKIDIISFGNDYDYIGGLKGRYINGIDRKANGIFLMRTDSDIKFMSRFNEDTNTCYVLNKQGKMIFDIMIIQMIAKDTGKGKKGGMKEVYDKMSDYNKCFYSIMCMPSYTSIVINKKSEIRLKKNNDCPKILSERYKK